MKTLKDINECGFIKPKEAEESFCFYEYKKEPHFWCDACKIKHSMRIAAKEWIKDGKLEDWTVSGGDDIKIWVKHFFNLEE